MGFSKCGWSCFVGNWGILLEIKRVIESVRFAETIFWHPGHLTSPSLLIAFSWNLLLLASLLLRFPSYVTSSLLISPHFFSFHLISSHLFSCHHVIISCDLIWVNLVSSHLSSSHVFSSFFRRLSFLQLISSHVFSSLPSFRSSQLFSRWKESMFIVSPFLRECQVELGHEPWGSQTSHAYGRTGICFPLKTTRTMSFQDGIELISRL
jgi:hypothetical protein